MVLDQDLLVPEEIDWATGLDGESPDWMLKNHRPYYFVSGWAMKHEAPCWAVCLTCDADGLVQSDTLSLGCLHAVEKTYYPGLAEDWSVRQAQPFFLKVRLTLILEM